MIYAAGCEIAAGLYAVAASIVIVAIVLAIRLGGNSRS